jgi:hypothetical protein
MKGEDEENKRIKMKRRKRTMTMMKDSTMP